MCPVETPEGGSWDWWWELTKSGVTFTSSASRFASETGKMRKYLKFNNEPSGDREKRKVVDILAPGSRIVRPGPTCLSGIDLKPEVKQRLVVTRDTGGYSSWRERQELARSADYLSV